MPSRQPAFLPRLLAAMTLAIAVLTASPAAACPNCKENLSNGKNAQGEDAPNVAQGFAWSIYVMLAVPFTMAGLLGFAAWKLSKHAAKAQQRIGQQGFTPGA